MEIIQYCVIFRLLPAIYCLLPAIIYGRLYIDKSDIFFHNVLQDPCIIMHDVGDNF